MHTHTYSPLTTIFKEMPPGPVRPPMSTSFGTLFTPKVQPGPKYHNDEHRQKVRKRTNIDRVSKIPMEAGNWAAALQLISSEFRRPGLSAVHLEEVITIGMKDQLTHLRAHYNNPHMGRVSDLASPLDASSHPSKLPPNAIVHPNPRDLPQSAYAFAKVLMDLRDAWAEGTYPQSISLWEQLVTSFASLGLLHEALDTADMAAKSNTIYKKGSNGSSGRMVSGISRETSQRMGRMLLPLAASQGKLQEARDIAQHFFHYVDITDGGRKRSSATTTNVESDAFVRRWLAEAASATGDWAYALRVASQSSSNTTKTSNDVNTPSTSASSVPHAFTTLSRDAQRSSLLSSSSDGSWEVALGMVKHMYGGDAPVSRGDLPAILNALGGKHRSQLQQQQRQLGGSEGRGHRIDSSPAPWESALELFANTFPCVLKEVVAGSGIDEMPTGDVSQQSADLVFAMLPAPSADLVAHQIIHTNISNSSIDDDDGNNNHKFVVPPFKELQLNRGANLTITLLNRLCFNTDNFMISTPVAHAAARSLLWLSTRQDAAGTDGGSGLWTRALSLMKSSPLTSRAATNKGGAGPLESDLAALVRCMEVHGPSPQARLAALTWFPHLIPKEVFPHRLQHHLRALNSTAIQQSPPLPSQQQPHHEHPQQVPHSQRVNQEFDDGEELLPPSHPLYPFSTYDDVGLPADRRQLVSNAYKRPSDETTPNSPQKTTPRAAWHSMARFAPSRSATPSTVATTVSLDPEYESMREATSAAKDVASLRPSTSHYFKKHLERKANHESDRNAAMKKIYVTERQGFPLYEQGDATTRYSSILSTRPSNHPSVLAAGGQQKAARPTFGVFDDLTVGEGKRDAFSDPTPIPMGLNDTHNGYSYYKFGGGNVVRKSTKSIASPLTMRPKHFDKLKDPLRSWKESTLPFMGVSPVVKFSPGKAL